MYNKLAMTKGFIGGNYETGGIALMHPFTPIRATTAAFDPIQKNNLNPLASLAGVGIGGYELLDTQRGGE